MSDDSTVKTLSDAIQTVSGAVVQTNQTIIDLNGNVIHEVNERRLDVMGLRIGVGGTAIVSVATLAIIAGHIAGWW